MSAGQGGDEARQRHWLLGVWGAGVGLYVLLSLVSGRFVEFPLRPETLTPEGLALEPGILSKLHALAGFWTFATLPGLPLALSLPSADRIDGPWLVLRTLGFSLLAYVIELTFLKALGLPIAPASLVVLGLLVGAVGGWTQRNRLPELALGKPSSSSLAFFLGLMVLTCALVWQERATLFRELGQYWYHPDAFAEPAAEETSLESRGIQLTRSGDWQKLDAEFPLYRRELAGPNAGATPEEVTVSVLSPTRVTLRYLWWGPVGSRLTVACEDLEGAGSVERAPTEAEAEGPTLRYLDQGLAWVELELPVREKRACALRPEWSPPVAQEGQETQTALTLGSGPPSGTLLELTAWPEWAVREAAQSQNWPLMHYYQILNIAENTAWARETLQDRWVTLNQPPLWSYVYSGLVLYLGTGLWAVNLFFVLLVAGLIWLARALVQVEHGEQPPWLFVPLALIGLSHARIILASSSTNFPDNLYAFGVLASLFALWQGRTVAYGATALATTLVRYPGSALSVLGPLLFAWRHPGRRKAGLRALLWWGILTGALCAGFLLVGAVNGVLGEWLEILHFETLPEHFHDNYDPRELLSRPVEFYGLLLQYSGYTPLLLVLARGRMATTVGLLALLYTFLLCFIDHFPSHYFVPPMYLLGVAVTSLLATWTGARQWVGVGLATAGLLYGLWLPLG